MALLDQESGNVLDTDTHYFSYESGDGTTQSGTGSYDTPTSGYQSQDSIMISYPNVGTLYASDENGMQVNWNYQSQSNDMQSLSWAYKLDEDFYGTGTSATQVSGTDSVSGSSWLSGVSYGSHTLYVALLDQGTGSQLITDSHSFTYQSGDGSYQSENSGYESTGDGYQSETSSYDGPTEWTFTNAGAEGSHGPTQSQINSSYLGTSLHEKVTINTQGIQEWSVPVSGTYKIEAWGSFWRNECRTWS